MTSERPDRDRGVFKGLQRRRAVATRARRKVIGGFALVAAAIGAGAWVAPEATMIALQVAIPVMRLGVIGGALFFAVKAVARLVTGRYRAGRTDFGLPHSNRPSRKRLRPRQ